MFDVVFSCWDVVVRSIVFLGSFFVCVCTCCRGHATPVLTTLYDIFRLSLLFVVNKIPLSSQVRAVGYIT